MLNIKNQNIKDGDNMKKLRLRKWVKVVLYLVILISGFIMILEHDSIRVMIIKTILTAPFLLASTILLNNSDDLRGDNNG